MTAAEVRPMPLRDDLATSDHVTDPSTETFAVREDSRRFRLRQSSENLASWEHRTEWPMVGLSLLFLAVIIMPYAHDLTRTETATLNSVSLGIWAIFVFDYTVRIILAPDRRRFVFTHWFDLLIIAVPFLRPLRIIRVLSLVIAAGRRAGNLVVQEVVIYFLLLATITMSSCAVLVYHFERSTPGSSIRTLGDAFWWALTTISVGHADRNPVTADGRIMAIVLMFTGIAVMATVTAAIAAKFVDIVRGRSSAQLAQKQLTSEATIDTKVDVLTSLVHDLRLEIATLQSNVVGHPVFWTNGQAVQSNIENLFSTSHAGTGQPEELFDRAE